MTSRAVPPWWAGLAEASTEIDCSGQTHHVRWVDGCLRTDDHDDADAETALVALGADAPSCLALVAAWNRHCSTPELVTLGRRPGEHELGLAAPAEAVRMNTAARSRALAKGANAGAAVRRVEAAMRRRFDLLMLLSLPGTMIDRLVLTVLASCAERWDDEGFRADHGLRVGAALSTRATPALRRFGAKLGYGPPDVGVSPVRPGREGPVVAARAESDKPMVVSAELPVAWLSNVWGRGVSEPGDEFVLAVLGGTSDGRELDVYVADWEPVGPVTWEAVPVPATVVLDGDGFRQVHRTP